MKYRGKPVVVEAYMFAGGSVEPGFPNDWMTCEYRFSNDGKQMFIETLEGKTLRVKDVTVATKGDWIIKDKGEFRPCKPDIFEQTYEKVEEGETK